MEYVDVYCKTTGRKADIKMWRKEVNWYGYRGDFVKYNDLEEPYFEITDNFESDHVDTLEENYDCDACRQNELPIEHFEFRDEEGLPPAPTMTHGARL